MSKLFFFYSSMNAGKTTSLLQCNYTYRKMKYNTLLFVPSIAKSNGFIVSRIGLKEHAITIDNDFNIFKYVRVRENIKLILVDEAQFLTKKTVFELISIVDYLNIDVFTYGLRTDFKSNLFIGSKYLLTYSDKIIELKTLCFKCSKKAIMNAKLMFGKRIIFGKQIEINKEIYLPVCRYHYYNFNKIIV